MITAQDSKYLFSKKMTVHFKNMDRKSLFYEYSKSQVTICGLGVLMNTKQIQQTTLILFFPSYKQVFSKILKRRWIQQFIEIIKNIEFNNLWGIKLEVSKSDSL